MTVRIPSENLWDKTLKLFGKERKLIVPNNTDEVYKQKGPYVQIKAKREGFLNALFRKNT